MPARTSSSARPRLDRWARILTTDDPDAALSQLLSDLCLAVGASCAVLLQSESSHEAERIWSHSIPDTDDQQRARLTDTARLASEADLVSAKSDASQVDGDHAWCLETGHVRVGALALSRAGDLSSDSLSSVMADWTATLASALSVLGELGRMQGLVSQYERGFQTLDRQVRVLDLERQKLAAVLNNAEIGFLVVDPDLLVTWSNPAMALHLNASNSGYGILRQSCHDVVCGRKEPCAACPARAAHESGEAKRAEISSDDDSQRRLYTIAVPIRGSSGDVQETLLMVQDLTGIDALRQSEARYRLLFETSADAIFMASPPEFRIVLANPATFRLLGFEPADINAFTLADIHGQEDWQRMAKHYERVVEGYPLKSEDCMVLGRDGTALYCNLIALPFELEDQAVVMCNLRDITARKQAEQDLARSFSLLQGTLESTTDGILVVDHQRRVTSFNQKFLRMWRVPNDVIQSGDDGQTLAWVLPQLTEPDAFLAKLQELYSQPEVESYDLLAFKDGRVYERYSQPHRIAGKSVGRVWSFRDITDRETAERSLQYRMHFENLISTLSTHFINLATEDIDAGINEALRSIGEFAQVDRSYIFLFSEDGTLMSNTHEWCAEGIDAQKDRIQNVPAEAFPWISDQIRRVGAVHIPRVSELPDEAAAEKSAFLAQGVQSVSAVPIIYGKTFWGFLGFDSVRQETRWTEDVMALLHIAGELFANALARKRAEHEKISLEEQLRQSQKMEAVGTLAGGIAHDFNNLLTGILGYADMLRSGGLSPRQTQKAADVIERAARRAAELTQQLLGFARKGKYQNIPVDLHAIIAEVTTLLGRTLEKSIILTQDLLALEPFVLGDPVQIQQVILNLSVNARDAMADSGTLSFVTERIKIPAQEGSTNRSESPTDYIKLVVSDTGCGITDEVRPRIFEPFFTTKEQGKGTGMGLSMVYGIVKNHGGTINVYSEAEVGTSFEILWPAVGRPSLVVEEDEDTVYISTGHTVLLVDDEELVRTVARTMLETLGYRVLTACDGVEAVDIFRRKHSDIEVVILDMAMPRMGGRECFLELKAIDPDVRAVLSTGYALDEVTQRVLDEGMLGFAQKPYVLDDLAKTLAGALAAG